eukprot:3514977-Heterocapsa_arctica.AAC.1
MYCSSGSHVLCPIALGSLSMFMLWHRPSTSHSSPRSSRRRRGAHATNVLPLSAFSTVANGSRLNGSRPNRTEVTAARAVQKPSLHLSFISSIT